MPSASSSQLDSQSYSEHNKESADTEDENDASDSNIDSNSIRHNLRSDGTLWTGTTRRAGERGYRVRAHNQAVWGRTLVILQGAMISGMLAPGVEVGYIRWWPEHPLDLSNRMAQAWAMSAQRVRKEERLDVQPDMSPNPTEARGVCPFLT
jgi:hypothetical protein